LPTSSVPFFHYISRAVTARSDVSLSSARQASGFGKFPTASCEKREDSGYRPHPGAAHGRGDDEVARAVRVVFG
jgi:hypothetical protein